MENENHFVPRHFAFVCDDSSKMCPESCIVPLHYIPDENINFPNLSINFCACYQVVIIVSFNNNEFLLLRFEAKTASTRHILKAPIKAGWINSLQGSIVCFISTLLEVETSICRELNSVNIRFRGEARIHMNPVTDQTTNINFFLNLNSRHFLVGTQAR